MPDVRALELVFQITIRKSETRGQDGFEPRYLGCYEAMGCAQSGWYRSARSVWSAVALAPLSPA
jgi:hypothetical protein